MLCKIPFQLVAIESDGVHLILNAKINRRTCRLLIDTGASRTVFDQNRIGNFVDDVEMLENEQLSTGLGTNEMKSHIITLESFEIGDLFMKDYTSVIIDMVHINQSFEAYGLPAIDGVIGGDILLDYKAEIDYRKKELRLRVPKKQMRNN
ncbi:MAG: clan AA aspartic protease [Bacteroidales bacterium]|nr:clan AA aspartic protease [Bacteroidales bacterium]